MAVIPGHMDIRGKKLAEDMVHRLRMDAEGRALNNVMSHWISQLRSEATSEIPVRGNDLSSLEFSPVEVEVFYNLQPNAD